MRSRTVAALCAAACAVVNSAGCVERAERFTIRPDGSVFLELNYSSDSLDDIYAGDAVPIAGAGNGWIVEEREQADAEGKITHVLHAVLVVEPGLPLPSTYAAEGNAEASGALQFPTELIIEPRDDGAYYHFRRIYQPRRWAYVELKRREIIDEPLKGVVNKPEAELTDADRSQLLQAFAQFEVEKSIIFAREALLEAVPETAQDHWLAVEAELRRLPTELNYAELIRIIDEPNERTRDRALKAEVEKFERELRDRLEKSAQRLMSFNRGKLNRFLSEYETNRKEHTVTEDIGDDVFRITVEMPGAIVASNAKSADATAARWEFSGQQLRDDAVELMVTSMVR